MSMLFNKVNGKRGGAGSRTRHLNTMLMMLMAGIMKCLVKTMNCFKNKFWGEKKTHKSTERTRQGNVFPFAFLMEFSIRCYSHIVPNVS